MFFSFVCSFKKITHRFARLAIFLCSLPIKDGGDFEKFIKDMKADETDLRLRASHQMGAQINPTPTYCQPLSQSMDGYATARRKHEQRITRLTNPSGSARSSSSSSTRRAAIQAAVRAAALSRSSRSPRPSTIARKAIFPSMATSQAGASIAS